VIDSSDSRWIRVKELFAEAIELTPEARAESIARICARDLSLRRELEALLDAHDRGRAFHGARRVRHSRGEIAKCDAAFR
jgi:hypothetical protein